MTRPRPTPKRRRRRWPRRLLLALAALLLLSALPVLLLRWLPPPFAIGFREALETPEKRIAVITPDRALARRVLADLARGRMTEAPWLEVYARLSD